MRTPADKQQKNVSTSNSNVYCKDNNGKEPAFQFSDHRPVAFKQRTLQAMANQYLHTRQTAQLQTKADDHTTLNRLQTQASPNKTGLPNHLKSGIENLSGYSMDDVKVHYQSDKPAQLHAHAYAQGTHIHIASGQEKHLPHEAWHVVQQKQGRVKPTLQTKDNVNINDDVGLEQEADMMGQRALQLKSTVKSKPRHQTQLGAGQIHQCLFRDMGEKLSNSGSSVEPKNKDNQNDKEKIFSQAFAKVKTNLKDLTALKGDQTKSTQIKLDDADYKVNFKIAPFAGKGSGAPFVIMQLNRIKNDGPNEHVGDIVVKLMAKHQDLGIPEFDIPAKRKLNDEIGTLDMMSGHDYAPTFHGATLIEDTYFVGMELASGDLSSTVKDASKADISNWLRQTLKALSDMHKNNRAHGDVKGDNVMISKKGNALLGDFGETTNLDPNGPITQKIRYNAQKDDIKRFIQMVYKNLFSVLDSDSELLTHIKQRKPQTSLDEICATALKGCLNDENTAPEVSMQSLASQLDKDAIWPK